MNRRLFLSLAPLILVPEPRRAYSFVGGWLETERERLMRLTRQAVRDAFTRKLGFEMSDQPFTVARAVEDAILLGGGAVCPPWMPRVTVTTDAFFLENKTLRVRVEWSPPFPRMYA